MATAALDELDIVVEHPDIAQWEASRLTVKVKLYPKLEYEHFSGKQSSYRYRRRVRDRARDYPPVPGVRDRGRGPE